MSWSTKRQSATSSFRPSATIPMRRARFPAAPKRARYQADDRPFIEILQREAVVLLCYCPASAFCHRHLAVDILDKIAQAKGLPFGRGGELAAS